MAKHLPTPDFLRKILRYELDTGKLFWLEREDVQPQWNARWAGKEAFTTVHRSGYKHGHIMYKRFLAHRVIWAIFYDCWPENQIDHINGVRDDNRIKNLRHVTAVENSRNQKLAKNNTSGVTGVFWNKWRSKWEAFIRFDGKNHLLGRFDCKSDAIAARRKAEKKYGFHENHGKR